MPALLCKTLSNTGAIESALSVPRDVTIRVKRQRDGEMRRRWYSAGLQRTEVLMVRDSRSSNPANSRLRNR